MKINLTPFQLKVLKEVLKIPPGEVKSYTWLAKKVGSPGAVRAVGTVLRKNPFPVIIPCHRVIKSDGEIGGYSQGSKKKKLLLELEQKLVRMLRST